MSEHAADAAKRAAALVHVRRYEEARAVAAASVAASPTEALWYWLGQAHLGLQQPDEAMRAAAEALALAPHSQWPFRLRVWALVQLRRLPEAVASARRAVELAPNDSGAWVDLANMLMRSGELGAARDAAARAWRLGPENLASMVIVMSVATHGADWNLAELAAKAVLNVDPGHAGALHCLGTAARGRGDPEQALAHFRAALAAAPGSTNHLAAIQDTLNDLGRHDEAIAASRRVLDLSPDHPRAWCGIAQASAWKNDYAGQLEAATRAVELDPDDDFAWRLKASALWSLGRDDEALAAARAAAECADRGVMPARPWVHLTRVLTRLGRLDEAEQSLAEAARQGAFQVGVQEAVAKLALARRQPGRAAAAAAAALRRDEGDVEAHSAAGYAAIARGDWSMARAAFARGTACAPYDCCARNGELLARIELGEAGIDAAGLADSERRSHHCRCELVDRLRVHAQGTSDE